MANGEAERKEVEGKMEKKSIHPLVQIATTQMTKTLELTTPKLVGGTCRLLTMVVRGPHQQLEIPQLQSRRCNDQDVNDVTGSR
jgi:hypothetical protein